MTALCTEAAPNKGIATSVLGGATLVGMVTAFIAGKKPAEKTT